MLIRLALLFVLWPAVALGQSYLVEPTQSDCLARSAQQCTAAGCDGVQTKYWWECYDLAFPTTTGGVSGTGGTTALVIHPGTPYGTDGLTQAEIAAIQTEADLGAALGGRQSKAKKR